MTEISKHCLAPGCEGTLVYVDDEYGSLAEGGSYEVYRCDTCKRIHYCPLPD